MDDDRPSVLLSAGLWVYLACIRGGLVVDWYLDGDPAATLVKYLADGVGFLLIAVTVIYAYRGEWIGDATLLTAGRQQVLASMVVLVGVALVRYGAAPDSFAFAAVLISGAALAALVGWVAIDRSRAAAETSQ